MFRIFALQDIRNRAYVIDLKGNKVFYGTRYQCEKFIKYMEDENDGHFNISGRKNRDFMEGSGRTVRESILHGE